MKASNLVRSVVLIVVLFCISVGSSLALNPVTPPSQQLQQIISEAINYPEQAVKNCCTGSAVVTFSIDEEGRILINKMTAESPGIEKMVIEQLSEITCKGIKVATYEQFKVKITFKLIG